MLKKGNDDNLQNVDLTVPVSVSFLVSYMLRGRRVASVMYSRFKGCFRKRGHLAPTEGYSRTYAAHVAQMAYGPVLNSGLVTHVTCAAHSDKVIELACQLSGGEFELYSCMGDAINR